MRPGFGAAPGSHLCGNLYKTLDHFGYTLVAHSRYSRDAHRDPRANFRRTWSNCCFIDDVVDGIIDDVVNDFLLASLNASKVYVFVFEKVTVGVVKIVKVIVGDVVIKATIVNVGANIVIGDTCFGNETNEDFV
ncbi:hypothetical protein NDU88_004614 [Pleurodeles waltl]|uniref:Uncharacterized protein n=1 Tax=Pleurodeles waltl TaxID=8319 RepID=A0AAV7W9I0_PLEWA|nr:hypothetical protein NDU88_004614 [Pleurodeles waltl]